MNETSPRFTEYHWGFTTRHWLEVYIDNLNNELVSECHLKTTGGILALTRRYVTFDINTILRDAESGHFSPRPYKLAQPCDGTITAPVLSLFFHYCKSIQQDPNKLYNLAYPSDFSPLDIPTINLQAVWQGTEYPKSWNTSAVNGLIGSLTEINYHSLVSVLSDLVTA